MKKKSSKNRFNELDIQKKQQYFFDAVFQYKQGDYSKAEDAAGVRFFLVDNNYKIYQTKYLYAICVMKFLEKEDYSYETVREFCEDEHIGGGNSSKYTADTYIHEIIAGIKEFRPLVLKTKDEKEYYRNLWNNTNQYLDDMELENTENFIVELDGGKKEIYTTRYERNPKLRSEAKKIHGYSCKACGFNFEEKYGELGNEYIEVHHKKPLSYVNEEVLVNPKTDLVVLCSNCHKMIHRKRNLILTVEELKRIVRN